MTTDRIKEIQSKTAYPDSISVQQALLQVWNECVQEQLRIANVSGSLRLVDFIEEIEYMQGLYSNARYTQAEATRDKLAEQLDDLMRLGSNDR